MSQLELPIETPIQGPVDETVRSSIGLEAESHLIVGQAHSEHLPRAVFVLCSGGDDSMVLVDMARRWGWAPGGVVHVNTGTGVPETTEFVRATMADWGLPFHELTPPQSYEEVFIDRPIIDGLPGPGMHHIAYTRLKERPLAAFVKSQKQGWHDRIMFLTGIRHDESRIRMGYTSSIVDRRGATVWVNPIYHWTNEDMRAYRQDQELPRNPVSANLHMSGECLCGCFARPDELAQIEFFYPEVAARIRDWERQCSEKGLTYCQWGQRRGKDKPGASPLCDQCVVQMELETTEEGS